MIGRCYSFFIINGLRYYDDQITVVSILGLAISTHSCRACMYKSDHKVDEAREVCVRKRGEESLPTLTENRHDV